MALSPTAGLAFVLSPALAWLGGQAACHDGAAIPNGVWGGPHVRLEITGEGAEIEYDCAHGTIAGPLRPDGRGRFEATGTHVPEHGGAVGGGERPPVRPALYSGTVEGGHMALSVRLSDPAESLGPFALVKGDEGELVKCR